MDIPKNLRVHGRRWWTEVREQSPLEEAIDLRRLEMAGTCLDDIATSEKRIKTDGLFILDRYGCVKEHPAAKSIRDNKIVFCRILRELGLDLEPSSGPRTPRQYL
ncbi:MAG: hypothetical protein KAH24_10565 [Holophagae bacterium]|nr:hypothetical protein [Holophagae bacterium]